MCQGILFTSYCAKDVLHDCLLLGAPERLAYLTLYNLILASGNRLPDDDETLARLTMTGRRFPRIRAKLIAAGLIVPREGLVTNPRCDAAIARSERVLAQKIDAGFASAEKRKALKNKETGSTGVDTGVPTNHKPLTSKEEEVRKETPTGTVHRLHPERTDSSTHSVPWPEKSKVSAPPKAAPVGAAVWADQAPDACAEFEDFWRAYPSNNGAKVAAKKSYLKARARGVSAEAILAAARNFAKLRQDEITLGGSSPTYTPHGASWLNQERWADPILPFQPPKSRREIEDEEAYARLRAQLDG